MTLAAGVAYQELEHYSWRHRGNRIPGDERRPRAQPNLDRGTRVEFDVSDWEMAPVIDRIGSANTRQPNIVIAWRVVRGREGDDALAVAWGILFCQRVGYE